MTFKDATRTLSDEEVMQLYSLSEFETKEYDSW